MDQIILSSNHLESTEAQLAALWHPGLLFSGVGCGGSVWQSGKVQRGLDWLAEQTVEPEDMVLIGDTLHDYDTAKAMGRSLHSLRHWASVQRGPADRRGACGGAVFPAGIAAASAKHLRKNELQCVFCERYNTRI